MSECTDMTVSRTPEAILDPLGLTPKPGAFADCFGIPLFIAASEFEVARLSSRFNH